MKERLSESKDANLEREGTNFLQHVDRVRTRLPAGASTRVLTAC